MKKRSSKILIFCIYATLMFFLPDLFRHVRIFDNNKITTPTELSYSRSIYFNGAAKYDTEKVLSNQNDIKEIMNRISVGKYRMMGYYIFKFDVSYPNLAIFIKYNDYNMLYNIDAKGNVKFSWHGYYYGGKIPIESYKEIESILYSDK